MRTLVWLAFATLQQQTLQPELTALTKGFAGRPGICVQGAKGAACVNGDQRFSMQSVVKFVVGCAVLDAVEHQGWRLEDAVVVRKQDLSVFVQPIADLVKDGEYRTTVGDLVRRAIVDSDSGATDILFARLGGPAKVQAFLDRKGIRGMRVDRDERHLQSETVGLTWKLEYVDAALFRKAIDAVPEAERDRAYKAYQADERDTSTPRAMTELLYRLGTGKLLAANSTKFLIGVMEQTVTFPDRLKAGVAPGWRFGHKTGSSGTWKGVTAATNDVGIMIAPDGGVVAVTAFLGDSTAPLPVRSKLMADTTRLATKHYR